MKIFDKFKRGLAALLSLSVAMSAVFVFHFPMTKAYAAGEESHTHALNGESGDEVWTAWPPQNEEVEEDEAVEYPALPDGDGYYYLTADVEINETWRPKDGTYLCLNGNKITMTTDGEDVISVPNVSFTLCDCKDEGAVTHSPGCTDGRGVYNNGDFTMYGGAISGNNGGVNNSSTFNTFNMYGGAISGNISREEGAGVQNKGIFNMYGGTITGNTADNFNNGGGVCNRGIFNMIDGEIADNMASLSGGGVYNGGNSSFEMYGGKITDNTSNDVGGGVYLISTARMTVGGTPNITGNKSNASDSAAENNVFLPDIVITISKSNPLWGTETKIGVTNKTPPTESGTAVAYAENGLNYRMFFSADHDGDGRHPAYPEDDGNVVFVNTNTPPEDAKPPVDPKAPKPTGGNEGGEGDDPEQGDKHTPHDNTDWKPVSTADELLNGEGSLYLTKNIEISETWEPANDTVLCLNGKTLTMTEVGAAISVAGKLMLCDCTNKGGAIKHADGVSGDGITFTENGTLTVGGAVKIMSEVVLPSGKNITVDNLKEGAEIHVRTAVTPEADAPVPVTGDNGDNDYSSFFSTDNENCEFKTVNGKVVLAVKEQETPGEHKSHGDDDETEWKEITTTLPTESGHYYLTQDVTIPADWDPKQGTYICLNGHNISGTIGNSNVTLCNCKSIGSATVTVSANNTITLGGKLKADITLSEDAVINVDSDYPLTTDESIIVTTDVKPTENAPVTITGEIAKSLMSRFKSNENYKLKYEDGVIKLTYEKVEKPPVVDPPVDPTKHIHPICGDIDCRVRHNAPAEWTAWESATSLPAVSGSYYLTDDVELSEAWEIPYGVDIELCLNGHDITLKNNGKDPVVKIDGGASLILCDCAMYPKGSNTIVNNLASAISAAYVRTQINDNNLGTIGGSTASGVNNDGSFMMYGGVITNNRASGVLNSSDFVMNGGVILGNSAANGGGVYNRGISSTSASFTMEGGVIVDNYATNVGGGLYNAGIAIIKDGRIFANSAEGEGGGVYQGGALTVDHSAYISKNKVGSSANNVFLPDGRKINIGTSLSGTVGVTLETLPTGSGKVDFATGEINSSTLNKIKSDNGSYTIKKSGSELALYRNTSSSGSSGSSGSTTTHDWELDITPKTTSQIPKSDRDVVLELLKTMPDWIVGAYYDVTLYDNGYEVDEATRLLDVELTIPSSVRMANREFKVIRVHDGKATLLTDIDSDPNTITVRSRYFSTYAVIYRLSQSGANGAGGSSNGTNGGYGNPAMGVQNDIPIAALACGFTALALAAPGKKLENV